MFSRFGAAGAEPLAMQAAIQIMVWAGLLAGVALLAGLLVGVVFGPG